MLHWSQVWKHMHELTGREIEKRAVMEVINHFEPKIEALIKQSEKERLKLNSQRKVQGLDTKKRIDSECIRRAIKILSRKAMGEGHTNGGAKRKEGVKNETHSQNEEIREVGIV